MWTHENRPQYDRKGLHYPSDQTHAEWALVNPSSPPANMRPRPGRCGCAAFSTPFSRF